MTHGIQGFFLERGRAARRVALISAGLASGLLAPLLALSLPPFRRPVAQLLHETVRFGYEGHDQYVRRITLQQLRGSSQVTHEAALIETRGARRGGAVQGPESQHPRAMPETRPKRAGSGSAESDLRERAVTRRADVPVVRSEDLVIEYAIKPRYPKLEYDRDIQGKVMILALIDTSGTVVDVQVFASTGVRAFEQAAMEAVWQYRFRPFRPFGPPQEVYATIRFNFVIDLVEVTSGTSRSPRD